METEILQQILENQKLMYGELKDVKQKVISLEKGQDELRQGQDELRQGQDELRRDVSELKQKVTKIEVTLENEVKPNIKILAEGYGALNAKMDRLSCLNEDVMDLRDNNRLHNIAIKELSKRTAGK